MREPPPHVTDAAVLSLVRERWLPGAGTVEHLPVGFGAWHWRVGPLFATLDRLGIHHTADTLEAAYAGAAELAGRGLEFVVAPLAGPDGRYTAPLGDDALSVTRWREGSSGGEGHADAAMLARLHAEPPPVGIPRWHPLVGPDLPEHLAARTLPAWDSGPFGEQARTALLEHLDEVARWTADYLRLAAATDPGDLGGDPRRAAHPQPARHRRCEAARRLGVTAARTARA